MKNRKKGQGMSEYLIIVVVIALLSLAVVTVFGNKIRDMFKAGVETLDGEQGVKSDDMGGEAGSSSKKKIDDDWGY